MSALDEITMVVRNASAAASPSVVSIGRHGRGTGFVVATGRVLTNAHNLRDRTTKVRFADGRTLQGSVVGSDVDGDLVVLDVDTGDAPALDWSDTVVDTGDIAVTMSAGRTQTRATWGQVTAVNRSFPGPRGRPIAAAIEHTAPAPSGSSGGPLLDREGRVLGVNTHRLDHGFYLARSADQALRDRVAALAEGRSVEPLRLGVALAPADVARRLRRAVGLVERTGLLVRGVVPDSPAEAAGIEVGDLLVSAGDRELATTDDLFDVLGTLESGELNVGIVRGSEELTVTAQFPAPQAPAPAPAPSA